ncbi:methenyltetrahydrofolate synthase domain-containing protein isoform X2 [Hyperolius riggenbachi]|uniref:methenyltetrahydrofolate synthase domain-containing protein isoform X2 n=1 Tax=Hyperolius riggenbachi TaxID=752182 RepID=UPI0035A3C2E1
MEPPISLSAGCSKQDIRQKVWDYIEDNNLANFPRPVHHRIPNFKGAGQACDRLMSLEEFQRAATVKINPDTPQKNARFLTLDAKKTLLVPTPRLRSGLFNKVTPPPGASKEVLRICSTSQGVRDFSAPLGLDAAVQVDLVVVGSVAVSEKGWRIGKGEGFADMEYAMMVAMGAVTDHTTVVTVVHDCQVLDFPEELLDDHDLTVDYILTPTRVIKTGCTRPKPKGIIWSKISLEMMQRIPILKKLREKESQSGKDVTLKDEGESSSKTSVLGGETSTVPRTKKDVQNVPTQFKPAASGPKESSTLYIGNIPPATRVRDLKTILRDHSALPLNLDWQGDRHRAFLTYKDHSEASLVLTKLESLNIGGHPVRVELARASRGRGNAPYLKSREDKQDIKDSASDLL